MAFLNRSTQRRLCKLPRTATVWEGDRRPLPPALQQRFNAEGVDHSEWVLWIEGNHLVRAMDIVPAVTGPEAIVRALLNAMEHPQGGAQPARPQKILVCDREIQFFLRGALQGLNIDIDYAKHLPLLEAVCEGMQAVITPPPPSIPTRCMRALIQAADHLWHDAPWERLSDHEIIAIDINHGDIDCLFTSVLGLLGMEYGLLFYRSEASLRQFRQNVLAQKTTSMAEMETVFLKQDCLFMNFEYGDAREPLETAMAMTEMAEEGIYPVFGSIHPLEGMRPFLDEEEATVMCIALEALHRFWRRHGHKLDQDAFPAVTGRYRIALPASAQGSVPLSVQVKTLPKLAEELWELGTNVSSSQQQSSSPPWLAPSPILREDLIPQESFFSLGMIPWAIVETVRNQVQHYQAGVVTMSGDGLPIFMIQTTRAKAKVMMQMLQAAGGVQGLGFTPGTDPTSDNSYDLGILKTNDGQFHLFGEYFAEDPVHIQARRKWDRRCQQTQGWCGFVIARGLTGRSRGNPQLGDFVALYEARSLSLADLGLGTLQMLRAIDWNDDED